MRPAHSAPRRPGPLTGRLLLAGLLAAAAAGCSGDDPGFDREAHAREILEWRETRLRKLTSDTGWLTLAGLGWLREGENTIGGDSSNRVVTPPGRAPGRLGAFDLAGGSIRFRALPGVEVTHRGTPVADLVLRSDEHGEPTELRHGSLLFYVIRRGDAYGVRIKDSLSPARTNFLGLDHFPVDPAYRFRASFLPYSPPRILETPTQAGTIQRDSCPGALAFTLNGRQYRIDAVIEKGAEDRLFVMFADGTSGLETYSVGRQLYTPLPDSAGTVILDFNLAYNWPCVFTVFSTCPITPRQNVIADRIEAGEKMYRGGTAGADSPDTITP